MSHKNQTLIAPDGEDQGLPLEVVARQRIGSQTIRKNAVLAANLILSASPEYFRPDAPGRPNYYQEDRLKDWVEACQKWLDQEYGKKRLLQVTLHLDEITPHLHVVYLPLDEKGKLNARGFLGADRGALSRLQDRYHQAISHLGIQRGQKKEKANYKDLRQLYAEANQTMSDRRRVWAEDIGENAWGFWLRSRKNIEGENYSIRVENGTVLVSHQERGALVAFNPKNNQVQFSEAVQEADSRYFWQKSRELLRQANIALEKQVMR